VGTAEQSAAGQRPSEAPHYFVTEDVRPGDPVAPTRTGGESTRFSLSPSPNRPVLREGQR